ncbi:MAG: hypothetical protein AAGK97_10950, partial [Bacteroidota bacterium]
GLNRMTWRMNRDGVRFPSRSKPKKDADPAGGPAVMPGTYKLVLLHNGMKDSTTLEVYADPRVEISDAQRRSKEETIKEFEGVVTKASESFDQLIEAKKTISRVNQMMVNAPDSTKTEIEKEGKEIQKKIKELSKLYMDAENQKGIQRDKNTLNRALGTARSLLGASKGAPGQNTLNAINNAKLKLEDVLKQVNTFINEDWKTYRANVEAIQSPLFKDLKVVDY